MRKRLNKIKNYAKIMSVVGMRHITGIGKAISIILSNMVAGTFIINMWL